MTKLIRSSSMMGGSGFQERFSRWWRAIFNAQNRSEDPREGRTERPFMFWDLSDG
jgi:hypothetical protein